MLDCFEWSKNCQQLLSVEHHLEESIGYERDEHGIGATRAQEGVRAASMRYPVPYEYMLLSGGASA
jgi:hypothetical protein